MRVCRYLAQGVGVALAALPLAAAAHSLTFEFRPSGDLRQMVSCTVQLQADQMVAVEITGAGFALGQPMRWPASSDDRGVLLHALGALLSDDVASVADITVSRNPDPPYVSVNWSALMTGGLESGLYPQRGFDLPPLLRAVVTQLLVGGPCAALVEAS